MADQNHILSAAHSLGALIASHPAIAAYRDLTRQLDLDIGARNLLGQFEQVMEHLAMKEASGQAIDLNERQQVQQLQQSIAIHPLLKKLMTAQQEYVGLMQKVQETINAGLAGQPAPAGASPILDANASASQPAPASKIILE